MEWLRRRCSWLFQPRRFAICTALGVSVTGIPGGCAARSAGALVEQYRYDQYVDRVFQDTEYPDTSVPTSDYPDSTPAPRTLDSELPQRDADYWNLTLEEAVHLGLEHSRVLNDLGGTILRSPETVQTNLNPYVTQTDPRFGIEAALSAFDAQYNFSANFEKNDRIYNNLFLSGGQAGRFFQQDLNVYRNEIVKQSATGGQYAVRHFLEYDANTAPSNLYGSAYTTWFEGEARQSLLQGAGTQFNRIAGPGATPGNYRGVMIARVNADMSQADFEIALRDYLSNIENAYWDLYNAYRELDGRVHLRDMALEIYEAFEVQAKAGKGEGFEEFRLDQLREQYYRFENDVQTALTGRVIDGTHTNNGSTGGSFRNTTGVYLAERRLRLLLGIPASDERLIRPADDPCLAETALDWDLVRTEALQRRPELLKQRLKIKRSELELIASRNFLLPKLDAVGRYRFRGFGHGMFDGNPGDPYSSAFGNLGTGDFQEWQLGLEMSVPIGFRQAYAGVSNAEFVLARDRTLLREQERQIVHNASNALAELSRAYHASRTTYDRRAAAEKYLDGLAATRELNRDSRLFLEQLLEAQRRFAEADSQHNAAVVEYQLAIKNVNIEKGSLLDYHNMLPVDGTVTEKASKSSAATLSAREARAPWGSPSGAADREIPGEGEAVREEEAVRLELDEEFPEETPATAVTSRQS